MVIYLNRGGGWKRLRICVHNARLICLEIGYDDILHVTC